MARSNCCIVVEPLAAADGGGWLGTAPDLPGCMSDGETPEEALRKILEAASDWIEEAIALRRPIPKADHSAQNAA